MAGGRPSKPLSLIKGHRTKSEKEVRQEAEQAMITNEEFAEWDEVKSDPVAHAEFERLLKIFKAINKQEALHETVINRFCLLLSDFKSLRKQRDEAKSDLKKMRIDTMMMAKQKAMFDIEKENIMTVQSVLRSIPKKVLKDPEEDPMEALLKRRSENR